MKICFCSARNRATSPISRRGEVSLFDRTSRVVKLSPDGEKFLPAAMRVVEEFQRAENYARDL
ncbi:hypothetical protein MJH54_29525, partial [Salmonella enterica subsp. enterica serovar Montevideo]|nr:hypothetical protein [Salmonella enterica subsp. enterica serovar Montevideo]